jgi:RNA polymerase sigma-70 factor, ECF subfamily
LRSRPVQTAGRLPAGKRVWQPGQGFRQGQAYVFRIARNLVVDHLRRREHELLEDREEDVADRETGNDRGADLDLKIGDWLASWVKELPQKYAEVLRLSELQGLPHREIASRLDLSVSGVKSRVQRGRALLRDKLLACCRLELDRCGGIAGYQPDNPNSCDC